MRKLIVGNWKMNGTAFDLPEILAIVVASRVYNNVDCALCLPSTLISRAALRSPNFIWGGQDCHNEQSGAHTGCISANMLSDAGANTVIIGHSERRADQYESNSDVHAKSVAAHNAGLSVIICVGETEAQRDANIAISTVLAQLADSVPDVAAASWVSIAYEPIWAIGTGRIPSAQDIEAMHGAIRDNLQHRFGDEGQRMRILYGGSMNGDNAAPLLNIDNVDGGLIGGASLSAVKFTPILAAADATAQ